MSVSHSLEETQKIAEEWLQNLAASFTNMPDGGPNAAGSDSNQSGHEAAVIGLSGHLGSGKTAFVKAVARALGVSETVTSPTFVIMKIYNTEVRPQYWRCLVHIDAYRLERGEELEAIGFEKLVADPANLIMVEWPENVKEMLASIASLRTISFSAEGENERRIEFQ